MLRKSTLLMLLALTLSFTSFAQEAWSLQKCIEHARVNNLTLRQSQIAISQAELTEKGSRMARMPTVNAGTNLGLNYGRSVNFLTNTVINTKTGRNDWYIDARIVAFNGGLINKTIEQSKHNLVAAQEDANARFQDISLQMATAYLSILLAKEQVNIAKKAIDQTKEQLTIIDKRIDAGTVPKADRLDIVAQIARNEQVLIQAENNVEINYLTLKNTLELEPDYNLEIIIPEELMEVETDVTTQTLSNVYAQALNSQASIKASEARIKGAELEIPIAKAGKLPSVVISGQLNTGYVNLTNFQNASFSEQLDNNFGQSFGASINIPIYNNHRNAINLEVAKLGILNADVQNRQAKQQLKADVQNAIAGARAARLELAASETSLEAAKAAYENAEKRYNLGAINTLDLTTAKTNLDTAELNVVSAKYDYIFRTKIIDFYLGKELKLN